MSKTKNSKLNKKIAAAPDNIDTDSLIPEKKISNKRLEKILTSIREGRSLKSMGLFLKILRASVSSEESQTSSYSIEDSKTFNRIMIFALTELPALIKELLNYVRKFR